MPVTMPVTISSTLTGAPEARPTANGRHRSLSSMVGRALVPRTRGVPPRTRPELGLLRLKQVHPFMAHTLSGFLALAKATTRVNGSLSWRSCPRAGLPRSVKVRPYNMPTSC